MKANLLAVVAHQEVHWCNCWEVAAGNQEKLGNKSRKVTLRKCIVCSMAVIIKHRFNKTCHCHIVQVMLILRSNWYYCHTTRKCIYCAVPDNTTWKYIWSRENEEQANMVKDTLWCWRLLLLGNMTTQIMPTQVAYIEVAEILEKQTFCRKPRSLSHEFLTRQPKYCIWHSVKLY